MKTFIEFKPQDRLLPSYVRFSVTKGAFDKMSKHPMGVRPLLLALSASSVLLLTKTKSEGIYEVFTANGSYLCKITNDYDALLIIGFNHNTLAKQNVAMKYGLCFKVGSGIIVQIKLQAYNYFFDIVNGRQLRANDYANRRVAPSLRLIQEEIAQADMVTEEQEDSLEEDYEPGLRLSSLLQTSEHYSVLSSELEEQSANATGRVSYFKIEAIEYDRVDRVAYRFVLDEIDEKVFKVGARLELEDQEGDRHSGEIINVDINETTESIDLLFNEQVDISQFPQVGWIFLSFSTVNKEVQLSANEKIRTGEAAAKYMDSVLGDGITKGFDNKDLSQVRDDLMKTQYPPNESQMDAICAAINSKDVFLVMGPPGTGKTTVILEWVKYFVKHERKRVLVSSQNNKAVDNVLARIVEEKDIDIIRIGSESKLQSDVKPYMFENKVKDLRKSISENTSRNMGQLKEAIGPWLDFSKALQGLIESNQEVDDLRQDFQAIIEKEIIPKYKQLVEFYGTYHKLGEKIEKVQGKISKRIQKINHYEGQTQTFKKIFFALPNFIRNLTTKISVSQFDRLRKQEKEIRRDYKVLHIAYGQVYHETLTHEFYQYYIKGQARDGIIGQTQKTMPQGNNKWGLFADISINEKAWKNTKDLNSAQEKIAGENQRANDLIETIRLWKEEIESTQNYALNQIVLESVDLVGATCIGINSQKRFADLDFDVTIIDEAGQIQIHNALVPMSVSNKLIMLGDHKQIPPIVDQALVNLCQENGVHTDLLEKSLFEHLYDDIPKENKIMLDTQYRMPSEIADTISEWFYDGQYLSADFKHKQKSQIPKLSSKPFVIIDTSKEAKRFERKIYQAGSNNPLEAKIIKDLIYHLSLDPDRELDELGVISAYKSQVKLIKGQLKGILSEEQISEMVATLDSYQGQERDIIIYSFTKSSNTRPDQRRIGFLNELRRLNVAMTRCKKMLILIGDMNFLSSCQHMDTDDYGDQIYEKSEKQFSDFVSKVLKDVEGGRGELLSYQEFTKRLEGGLDKDGQ